MIEFSGVSKRFRHGSGSKLLSGVVKDLFQRRKEEYFYALSGVSFRVQDGESLAIVGRNGAGKSTLLHLVAGLSPATEGTVRVQGRVSALLDLGSGMHPELTGIENLKLSASLMGLTRKRTAEVYDQIVEFADIGDFLKEPVRTYSTGMLMRLAFAIAITADPDILIVDEVLAVGDQAFQLKCIEAIQRFHERKKTLLFVSHSPTVVRNNCRRAIWLEHGRLIKDGTVDEILDAYGQSTGT